MPLESRRIHAVWTERRGISNGQVAPVKRIALDEPAEPWFNSAMTLSQMASYLRRIVLPLAFVVTAGATQVACAGTEQQTPPPQEPKEGYATHDEYTFACDTMYRGKECPPKEELYKIVGLCPDGITRCR